MPGFELDGRFRRFAGSHTLLRRFTAVIHRVAEQVRQRRFQPVKNVAVHLRILADDLEPDLFAKGVRQIAHHAREAPCSVGKRAHSCPQHFEVKPVGKMSRTAVEQIQFLQPFAEIAPGFGSAIEQFTDVSLRLFRRAFLIQQLPQIIERAFHLVVHPLKPLHGLGEGAQPA